MVKSTQRGRAKSSTPTPAPAEEPKATTLTIRFKGTSVATLTALRATVDKLNERNPDAPQWNVESLSRAILGYAASASAYPPAVSSALGTDEKAAK